MATSAPNAENWYKDTLGRTADQSGLDYWNGRLAAPNANQGAIYGEFVSDAWKNGENINTPKTGIINSPEVPQNTQGQQAQQVPEAPAVGYTATMQAPVVNATSTGYEAAKQGPAINAAISERVVDPATQTVAGQVQGIINQNSSLMQQGRARSQQAANDRGLGNSSIAISAGESALYDAAMPIATADANVYGNAANMNTTAQNTANLTNAAAGNRVNEVNTVAENAAKQFGAASENQASAVNAGAANTVNANNAQASSIASQFGANATNTQNLTKIHETTQMSIATLQSETQKIINAQNLSSAERNARLAALTQTNIASAANLLEQAKTKLNTDTATSIALANNSSAQTIASLGEASKLAIAKLDSANKELLNVNANAANLHAQAMQAIANVEQSQFAGDKAGAVQQILDTLNNGLSVMGLVGKELDFSPLPTPSPPAAPVVPPADLNNGWGG